VTEPIIKGKNYKKRSELGNKQAKAAATIKSEEGKLFEKPSKGLLRKSSLKLDNT